ncbi:MAG: sigma-70 family RNA polymerase sigma factor [Fimbriimonadales bacterium]
MIKTGVETNSIAAQARDEEAAMVLRARQGDERSLRELIGRHRVRLIRTAASILRDASEAEDVAQESFLKAFRELHQLRDDRAFSSFIYRICVRLCVDRLRLKKPETAPLESTLKVVSTPIETKVLVERLLEKLPTELRTTLVLREIEQLSYDEVAKVMEVPIGTVRSRLHAARERFRALWLSSNE